MARNLASKQNVQSPDTDYPYGRIKDDSGSGDGTPVDENVYGDFHQFFARMFAKSGLTYNNFPDNDYTGFQFYEAARKLFSDGIGVITTSTGIALDYNTHYNKLIFISGASTANTFTLIDSSNLEDGATATFYNDSDYEVEIEGFGFDSVMGSGSIFLYKSGDFVKLKLDKANKNWVIENYKITPVVTPEPASLAARQTFPVTGISTQTYTVKFTSETLDADNINNTSTGAITPIRSANYRIAVNVGFFSSTVSITIIYLILRKNGSTLALLDQKQYVKDSIMSLSGEYAAPANGTTDYFDIIIDTNDPAMTYEVSYATVVCNKIP